MRIGTKWAERASQELLLSSRISQGSTQLQVAVVCRPGAGREPRSSSGPPGPALSLPLVLQTRVCSPRGRTASQPALCLTRRQETHHVAFGCLSGPGDAPSTWGPELGSGPSGREDGARRPQAVSLSVETAHWAAFARKKCLCTWATTVARALVTNRAVRCVGPESG